ncbi:hypothetical protein RCL1_001746 [Eukaryota sp. TZLM3-RCL]
MLRFSTSCRTLSAVSTSLSQPTYITEQLQFSSIPDVFRYLCSNLGITSTRIDPNVINSFSAFSQYVFKHCFSNFPASTHLYLLLQLSRSLLTFSLEFLDNSSNTFTVLNKYFLDSFGISLGVADVQRITSLAEEFVSFLIDELSSSSVPLSIISLKSLPLAPYPDDLSFKTFRSAVSTVQKRLPPARDVIQEVKTEIKSFLVSNTAYPETDYNSIIETVINSLKTQDTDTLQDSLFNLLGPESFELLFSLLQKKDSVILASSICVPEVKKVQVSSLAPKVSESKTIYKYSDEIYAPDMIERQIRLGTVTVDHQEYEETRVKPPAKLSTVPELKSTKELSPCVQSIFSHVKSFNTIQSIVFDSCYRSNSNMLVCAPTGAGKTNIALLAMAREIERHFNSEGVLVDKDFKIVYLAPMKALASEVVQKMTSSLAGLGLKVREVTGDTNLSREEIEKCHLIVATPEKFDVLTRKSMDSVLVSQTRLIVIDEVHLLADDRGAVLEALVARTLRQVELRQEMTRILGLSATLPNYKDVAEFLKVPKEHTFYFDGSYRPIPLTQYFVGVKTKLAKNLRRTEIAEQSREEELKRAPITPTEMMNRATFDFLLRALNQNQQVIIFVHSRGDTIKTANYLLTRLSQEKRLDLLGTQRKSQELSKSVSKFRSNDLRQLSQSKVGAHHAGLLRCDRNLVERLFSTGDLRFIVCTSTLAWGVNLPAHWVIIKGTQVYNSAVGGFTDISILDVHQCFGRAGRPGFDTFGEAVLITEREKVDHFLRHITMTVPIESRLITRLPEHLNAEIVLGTISNIREAVQWLRYTFMFTRMKQNPLAYGVSWEVLQSDPELFSRRFEMIVDASRRLAEVRMVLFNEQAEALNVVDTGRIASHYYLTTSAIELFNDKLIDQLTLPEIFRVISSVDDFQQLQIRDDEIPELEELRMTCLIEIIDPISTVSGKVNVLIQSFLSNIRPHSFSLNADYNYISQNLGRIIRGMFELALKRGFPELSVNLLSLSIGIARQIWPFSSPLRQFDLSLEIVKKFEDRGLNLDQLFELSDSEIIEISRTRGALGAVKNAIHSLPFLNISTKILPLTSSVARLMTQLSINFDWSRHHGQAQSYWLLVEVENIPELVYSEQITIKKSQANTPIDITFVIPIPDPRPAHVMTRVISDLYFSVESHYILPLHNVIFPENTTHFTPLLPLIPLKTSILPPLLNSLKIFKYPYFNPIQTQVFHTAFHTDKNILLGAPTGFVFFKFFLINFRSGKTLIAELCILRLVNLLGPSMNKTAKVVFIAPLKALVNERFIDWSQRFRSIGHVIALTGESHVDSESLSKASIIITVAEKWDSLSRGWEFRKFVRQVGLVILDEVHTLGSERGSVIEAVVMRMKSFAIDFSRPIRFVGLSTHLSNVNDLRDFLSCSTSSVFNFHPSVRPVPVEVHLSSFPGPRAYCPRMKTMNKPIYSFLNSNCQSKPAIVFVASRRQTRLTAYDLITFLITDDLPTKFIGKDHKSRDLIDDVILKVKDAHLRDTLAFGIGLHHAGLDNSDKNLVENLFVSGAILLLVSTSTLAYGLNTPAHAVIIKGTEYFDAKSLRYVQYPLIDVLQMIGRAGRPGFDTSATALVMVNEPVRFFYKRFLYEAFPIESSFLNTYIDHLNAEIVSGKVKNKSQMIDWLKQSFFYKRVVQNPDFYGLEIDDVSQIDTYLSILIDSAQSRLIDCSCVELAENGNVIATSFGQIACFYYLSHKTLQFWNQSLSRDQSNLIDLISLVAHSFEFSELPVRHNEELLNAELAKRVRFLEKSLDFSSPFVKTKLLIEAHIDHVTLPISDYYTDLKLVLDNCGRVVNGLIDFAAKKNLIEIVFRLIYLLQSINSKVWQDKADLKNLPFMDSNIFSKFLKSGVDNLPVLLSLFYEDSENFNKLIEGLNRSNVAKISSFLSKWPLIDIKISKISNEKLQASIKLAFIGDASVSTMFFVLVFSNENVITLKRIHLSQEKSRSLIEFDCSEVQGNEVFVTVLPENCCQLDFIESFVC